MTTTDSSAPLVVRGAAGLLAAIPPALGFRPRDSLVQVCLYGPRDRVGPVGRVDLDPPVGHPRADYQAGVTDTLLTVAQRHAERVVLVWYRDTVGRRPAMVAALSRKLGRSGIPVIDVVEVCAGRYRSERHGTGTDPWLSVDQPGPDHPDVQRLRAATALRGRTVLADRDGLRRAIAGPPARAPARCRRAGVRPPRAHPAAAARCISNRRRCGPAGMRLPRRSERRSQRRGGPGSG